MTCCSLFTWDTPKVNPRPDMKKRPQNLGTRRHRNEWVSFLVVTDGHISGVTKRLSQFLTEIPSASRVFRSLVNIVENPVESPSPSHAKPAFLEPKARRLKTEGQQASWEHVGPVFSVEVYEVPKRYACCMLPVRLARWFLKVILLLFWIRHYGQVNAQVTYETHPVKSTYIWYKLQI